MENETRENYREDFCPSCLVVPLAFAGAGATAVGGTGKHKKWKKALLVSGIVTLIFTILLIVYYFANKKSCTSCMSP